MADKSRAELIAAHKKYQRRAIRAERVDPGCAPCEECGCMGNCECGHECINKEECCTLVNAETCPCCVAVFRDQEAAELAAAGLDEYDKKRGGGA